MRRESYPRGSTLKRGSEVDESINHLYPALAVAASIGSIGPFYYLSETLRINDIEVFKKWLAWAGDDIEVLKQLGRDILNKIEIRALLKSIVSESLCRGAVYMIQATLRFIFEVRYMMPFESLLQDNLEFIYRGYHYYKPITPSIHESEMISENHISAMSSDLYSMAHPSVDRMKEWIPRYTSQKIIAKTVLPWASDFIFNTMLSGYKVFSGAIHYGICLSSIFSNIFNYIGEVCGELMFTHYIQENERIYPNIKRYQYLINMAFQRVSGFITSRYILPFFWPYTKQKGNLLFPKMPQYNRQIEKKRYQEKKWKGTVNKALV